jgi:hypothetical protein
VERIARYGSGQLMAEHGESSDTDDAQSASTNEPTAENPPTPEEFRFDEDDIRPEFEEEPEPPRDEPAAIVGRNYDVCQPDLTGAMSGESDRVLDGRIEWNDNHTLY